MSTLALLGGKPVRDNFLPFFLPTIEQEEIDEVVDALKSNWITTGPKTHEFEEMFREYIGCKHTIALNSCTAGLHLTLVAASIGERDEVITSPFTFAATANVIVHQGAKPVFVDIRRDTYNIDPGKIEAAISEKSRAIMPVHYAGQPCQMDEIMAIAKKYNLLVVEDAAHAFSATYKGKKIGTIGDITSFSFYATKIITTAEGGMITTDNDELAEKIRLLSLHGISHDAWKRYSSEGSWYYEILYPGYKYNMTDIQASMGIQQLKKLDRLQEARRTIAGLYTTVFKDMPEIIAPHIDEWVEPTWHLYPILINTDLLKIDRNTFIEALKAENIGTSVHFIPIHLHPYYRDRFGFKPGDFPESEYVYDHTISLPLFPRMTKADARDVIAAVKKIIEYYRR